MYSVFKYNNYRHYIRDYYLEKKRTTGYFTYRYFAQRAGFASPVFIKVVIAGKANLSNKSIEKLCQAMDLPLADCEYFKNLVWFNQAKTAEKKHQFLEKLRDLNQQYSAEVLETDKYDFYSKWYYSVLREIVPNCDLYDDFAALGALLTPALKKRETKKAVKLLEQLQLLQKQADGSYKQARKLISTGSEVESLAVRDLHLQMANLAEEAIENIPKKERDISGLTMGMSRNTYKRIIEELKNFRERIIRIIAEDEDTVDQVYRLNLQFFPLSKRIKGDTKGDKEGADDE
jgi:uncharacterized protein (TIGR02147 family)